ncbi:hypothetical protein EBT16_11255, partial [bacterium]|nr:hypothetical protein [bacterium]
GRNLVLMPTVKHLGISRRIESDRERRRLRDIFTKRLRVKGVGFIIRTVAEGKTFQELKADADYLVRTWQQIKRDSSQKRAPALIHEDLSLTYRTVRDYFTEDVDSLVIDNPSDHDGIQDFIGQFMPQLKNRVKLFKGPSQLFEHYGIEAEISRALSKKVWLKSGGYLLIDQSEALTAIDVNTGRYVGSKSLEETILRTNLEAVKEIAYQLRIRNVGGIIIIDLIDMESASNVRALPRPQVRAGRHGRLLRPLWNAAKHGLGVPRRGGTQKAGEQWLLKSSEKLKKRPFLKLKTLWSLLLQGS